MKKFFGSRAYRAALIAIFSIILAGCGAGGTATNAAAEAKAAKQAKQDMDKVQSQLDAAQKLQEQRLKQAEQQ